MINGDLQLIITLNHPYNTTTCYSNSFNSQYSFQYIHIEDARLPNQVRKYYTELDYGYLLYTHCGNRYFIHDM